MAPPFDQLARASNIFNDRFPYLIQVSEWQSKRQALHVLLRDIPSYVAAHGARRIDPHPTNEFAKIVDMAPTIRLAIACEAATNMLYSCAEIAANIANKASNGVVPSSFNRLRKKCSEGTYPEIASRLGDIQWYSKVREIRTELAHFSSLFIGEGDSGPILCVQSFRRRDDKIEFQGKITHCTVDQLLIWVGSAISTLDCFAGYLLERFVLPKFDLDFELSIPVYDDLGFPKQLPDRRVEMERVTVREYLRRGGIPL